MGENDTNVNGIWGVEIENGITGRGGDGIRRGEYSCCMKITQRRTIVIRVKYI